MKMTFLGLLILTLGSLSACTTVVKDPPSSTSTTTTESTVQRPVTTQTIRSN
jgi:hypothetical protein